METDRHNLMPSQGKDSNYSFVMISGKASRFEMCGMEIEDWKTESLLNLRGDRDRTYGDMDAT